MSLLKRHRKPKQQLALTNPSKAAQLRDGGEEKERVAADERSKDEWILGKADNTDANQHAHSTTQPTVDEITQRRLKLLEDDDE